MNKILVLGDECVDVNYFGEIKRIAPEAPIPIFNVLSKEEIPGMSANVAKNLKNAGNEVKLISNLNFNKPIFKRRYFVGNKLVTRIDEYDYQELTESEQESVINFIKEEIKDYQAVILQDYGKGFFNKDFLFKIVNTIKENNVETYIIADGNKTKNLYDYAGIDYLKLNEDEYYELYEKVKANTYWKHIPQIIVTLGDKGSKLDDFHIEALPFGYIDVIDVTGAGDTYIAWFTSELIRSHDPKEAMKIATTAAGISVTYIGCHAPTINEVEAYIR